MWLWYDARMKTTHGKDAAINKAVKPTMADFDNDTAKSDGNVVVASSSDHLAIAFNNSEYNQNTVLVLTAQEALILKILLNSIQIV